MKCIEEHCPFEAGTPWTDYWCPSCDEERRARITNQLEGIMKSFEEKNENT